MVKLYHSSWISHLLQWSLTPISGNSLPPAYFTVPTECFYLLVYSRSSFFEWRAQWHCVPFTKKPPISQQKAAHLLVIILNMHCGTSQVSKINGNKKQVTNEPDVVLLITFNEWNEKLAHLLTFSCSGASNVPTAHIVCSTLQPHLG